VDCIIQPSNNWDLGPVSRKPWKLFGPTKPKQKIPNLTIAELFYSHILNNVQRFTTYKKFQAYSHLRFYIQMNEKWLYGTEKFPGLSGNGPLE